MRWLALASGIVLGISSLARSQDLDTIEKRGTLRVLIVPPPTDQVEFWSMTPGPSPGFEREMVEAFAASRHLRVEVVSVDAWADIVPALLADKGDLIAGRFTETASRAEKIAFTAPVFPTRHVAVTRKPHHVVRSVLELRKEKVGTVSGTSLEEAVREAGVPDANIEALPGGTLLSALQGGKVSCIVWGVDSAIPAQRLDPSVQIGTFVGSPSHLAWGVRKTSPALLERLNEFITAHKKTTWSKLVVKYFGPSAPELLRKARTIGSGE
jgi:membrane-bound lytic murein transglycosylase F